MAIVQEAFYIPEDIATGLAIGLYRRIGGVVRHAIGPNKGQIVKHLKPIKLEVAEQAQGLGAKAIQFVQQHKKGVGIVAIGAAAVGIGAWGYNKWKNHEPRVLTEFRASLRAYINAIRSGDLDIKKVDALMKTLEALKSYKNFDKINIQLTAEDIEVLVGRIHEYTKKLASMNKVQLNARELDSDNGPIINLQSYLKAQRRILETAA